MLLDVVTSSRGVIAIEEILSRRART